MAPRAIEVVKSREDPFTGFGTTMAEARPWYRMFRSQAWLIP